MSARYNFRSVQLLERVPSPIPGAIATHQWRVLKWGMYFIQRSSSSTRDHKLEKALSLVAYLGLCA